MDQIGLNLSVGLVYFISVIIMYFQSMVLSIIPMHLNYTDKLGFIKQGYDCSALRVQLWSL